MADPLLVQSDTYYTTPIPESSNVRYVENRIVINAHHTAVYDFVTTWSNLPRWLPVATGVSVRKGNPNAPAELGDVLIEEVIVAPNFEAKPTVAPKIYTVVARVPGVLWIVAGVDDVGDPWIGKAATFTTTPLADGRTLFCRVFQQIRKESEEKREDRHPVLQPAIIQKGLEKLRDLIEAENA